MRVGEKETSEQAKIVARYADLFSREQLDALREAEAGRGADERERLYSPAQDLRGRDGDRRARRAVGRARERDPGGQGRRSRGRSCRCAPHRPGSPCSPDYASARSWARSRRRSRPRSTTAASTSCARARSSRPTSSGEPDPVAPQRGGEGASRCASSRACSAGRAPTSTSRMRAMRERWFDRLLGPERDDVPTSFHAAYVRRLSPLESTYTKERAVEICLETLRRPRLRPGEGADQARPRRSPAEVAPRLRDRLRPAGDRPPDHARAGRPARLPGVPARGRARAALRGLRPVAAVHVPQALARPRADRDLLVHPRGHLARSRRWHERYFGLSAEQAAENAEATVFLEALLFRRYAAKLHFELDFWSRFAEDGGTPEGYEERLTKATGVRYREDNYLADMDAGFYSADYLRAWIRVRPAPRRT